MKVEVNYGGLIPSFGYVGNHGLNDAAELVLVFSPCVRPKFEVYQMMYEVENCEKKGEG
jgi:hypothetical protein